MFLSYNTLRVDGLNVCITKIHMNLSLIHINDTFHLILDKKKLMTNIS